MMAATLRAPVDIWSGLGSIRRRVASAPRLFLFFDFDGTLAPIVPVPSLAAMPRDVYETLRALASRRDVVLVVNSGRALDDLRARVGLPIVYVGNHGLEIRGGGLEYTVREGQDNRVRLLAISNLLRGRLESYRGALVEQKTLSASVHVRQVKRSEVPAIVETVEAVVGNCPALRVSYGREVIEIRPKTAWNKGLAARWIIEQFGGDETDVLAMGDDSTDEDMFLELKDGITVRVGGETSTSAQYWIAEGEVARFIHCLRGAIEHLRPTDRR